MANQTPSQQPPSDFIGGFLGALNRQEEEKLTQALASQLNLPYVNLSGYPLEADILAIIPEEYVKLYGLIAYGKEGKKVKVAVLDAQNPAIISALKDLQKATGYEFVLALASNSSIRYGQQIYGLLVTEKKTEEVSIEKEETLSFEEEIKNLADLKEKISRVPTTKIVDVILAGAVKTGASDIHLEPGEKEIRLRYRLDGVLHDIAFFPKEIQKPLTSRLKFLAKMKLDVTRQPQDGRFFIRADKRRIDIRVSSLPSSYGESLSLRLFDQGVTSLSLENLGLDKEDYLKVERAIKKPYGLILVCGPTGSGKTTTLYAILDKINQPGVNIITLEDPIEYTLPGVTQSQVDPEVGYDFATGLRSILRQDPDILMVGEIRDLETAEMAIHAALTGHLVLSTLHTNDAAGAIPRLIDMKVRPFLIVNALNLVIAQRLVRRICPQCKKEYQAPEATLKIISEVLGKEAPKGKELTLWRGEGCDFCNQTGFKGRIGIFEILKMTEEMAQLALKEAPVLEIKKAALKAGTRSLQQDGFLKALQGITTIEEVLRVTQE